MKKICLLRGGEIFWPSIEIYLRAMNAEAFSLKSGVGLERVRGAAPDLLISGDGVSGLETLLALRTPVIVISVDPPVPIPKGLTSSRHLTLLPWPATKKEFLEKTAAILSLAPRREFRAVIRVGRSEDLPVSMAQSVDFSLTGMSFTSAQYFTVSTKIMISVTLPGTDRSVLFSGRVVRTFEDDAATHYGVEFIKLPSATRQILEDFILT